MPGVMGRFVVSTSVPKHVITEYILHRSTRSENPNCFYFANLSARNF
jgi:hypothetical protein